MKTNIHTFLRIVWIILLAYWPNGEVSAQSSATDSLQKLLAQPMPDTARAMLLEQLGSSLMYSEPRKALNYVKEGLALAQEVKFTKGIARNLNRLGSIYRNSGSYAKALEAHLEALSIARENDDLEGMARINNSIGILYSEQKDSRRAIEYFAKTKVLAEQLQDAEMLEISLTNIGTDYALLNELDSAQAYTLRAYEMAQKNQEANTSNMLFINLGNIQYRKKNYRLALDYYHRSLPLSESQADSLNLSLTYFEMARTFREAGTLDSSRIYAEKSLTLARGVNNPKNIFDAAMLLSELYEKTDVAKSFDYYKIATVAKDTMFNKEKVRQIENLGFSEELSAQQLAYEKAQYQITLRLYALLAGIVAALLVAFLLYRNVRQRQRANELLQHQKEELQTTLTELKATQVQLIQSEKMASLGELAAGIAHEIQNPLNFVNNYSEINVELMAELIQEEEKQNEEKDEGLIKELMQDMADNEQKILHHGKRAEAIVNGMQELSRRSSGTRESTDLNDLVAEYVKLAYQGSEARGKLTEDDLITDFDARIPRQELIPGDMGRVILNLLDNAIYAVLEKLENSTESYLPTISITTRQLERGVEMRVKDNGTGIPAKNMSKLYQPFFTTKPTGEGTGLGLSLAHDIVTKGHRGTLRAESVEGEGAEFIVVLPVGFQSE